MQERWRQDGKIIVLEPRRLAARAAAERMADTLGEKLGETVGLRVRLQTLAGPRTRIEVVTEGVFARMILDDPALEGVAAVLFDEFHERSLDADLGLALALDAQAALRPDLRLLVMSATLDGARVAALLDDAPVVESQGRAFPVETVYLGRDPRERIEEAAARAISRALAEQPGSILAFLPGQGEIARTESLLREKLRDETIDLCPLYGAMERAAQDRAIRPAATGRRKVVLATSIAETSITIDGVRVVVDCGLSRAPRFEPDLGLVRLETIKTSRAAADQRRGRAGRTQPGVCYRLWEEAATGALPAYAQPEILAADLAGLLLDLAAWGARDPNELRWLDPPPAAATAEARALLQDLGALDETARSPIAARPCGNCRCRRASPAWFCGRKFLDVANRPANSRSCSPSAGWAATPSTFSNASTAGHAIPGSAPRTPAASPRAGNTACATPPKPSARNRSRATSRPARSSPWPSRTASPARAEKPAISSWPTAAPPAWSRIWPLLARNIWRWPR